MIFWFIAYLYIEEKLFIFEGGHGVKPLAVYVFFYNINLWRDVMLLQVFLKFKSCYNTIWFNRSAIEEM